MRTVIESMTDHLKNTFGDKIDVVLGMCEEILMQFSAVFSCLWGGGGGEVTG